MLSRSFITTPLGHMQLIHDAGLLWAAGFDADMAHVGAFLAEPVASVPVPAPPPVEQAFTAYFAGKTDALRDMPVARFGSDFQRRVWGALRCIPPGETRSYGDIARALGGQATGKGGLARAVGLANGRNPLAIIVPCHRVIGANGSLVGYAGGLERKKWLLAHESRHKAGGPQQGVLL